MLAQHTGQLHNVLLSGLLVWPGTKMFCHAAHSAMQHMGEERPLLGRALGAITAKLDSCEFFSDLLVEPCVRSHI